MAPERAVSYRFAGEDPSREGTMPDMPAAPTPNDFWLLDTLVRVRVAHTEGADSISLLEHLARHGDSPPLHRHTTEDEVFHILEGNFRVRVGGEERTARPGDNLLAPRGAPHTYRVESPEGGRFLTVTVRGDFERFVRAMGRPAARLELPPPGGTPTPEAQAALVETARKFGIEIVGPPLT
jgi:quercetin dioxygenase-like cupin family protein